MTCKAIRCNDEMHCAPCGLRWAIEDPEPPACRQGPAILASFKAAEAAFLGRGLCAFRARKRAYSAAAAIHGVTPGQVRGLVNAE